MPDDLTAALEEIRTRNEWRITFHRYTDYTVEHDVPEGDVRRLLGALDAVLKRHYPVRAAGCCVICAEPYPCSEIQAITRELLGRVNMADIRTAQTRTWANKVAKGFNTTDVPMELGLLYEEIGEAFSAWRKQRGNLGGELADVAIFLLGLAEMTGVDLAAAIEKKMAVNEVRGYVRLPNGTPVKAESASELLGEG